MLTAVALTGVGAAVTFTGYRVGSAMAALRRRTVRTREFRDVVDAFSVELLVGARPVEAAEQAVTGSGAGAGAGDSIAGELTRQVRRVRLGAATTGRGDRDGGAVDEDVAMLMRLWATAERRGLALGTVMRRLVEDVDARLAHLGFTSSALAGARMTEVILLMLPVGALGIGESMGLEPAAFLGTNVLGVLVLLVGTLLACAGVLWVESLTVTVLGGVGGRAGPGRKAGVSGSGRRPGASANSGYDALAAARVLDVFAAATTAGLPVVVAWRAAVEGTAEDTREDTVKGAQREEELLRVARLLELGAGAAAWKTLEKDPHFGPVARRAASQVRNGGRMADEITGQADRLRRQAGDRARAGAERVLVAVAAPLTLCFLPAFVLVGLVPLVVGFAGV